MGEAKPRQIVSGVAPFYTPEQMVGKRVIVVSNLKPVKLRGTLSEGMVLAADHGEQVTLLEAPEGVPPGSRVR